MSIYARFQIQRNNFLLDVELNMPEKGITAIFGPSGCGKTTLLRAIAGLDHHLNGQLKINDEYWQNDTYFLPPHKRPLGYVFQEASLFAHLNVQKNLAYGTKRVAKNQQKIAMDQAIELLGISHLLNRKPHTLSGGEKQRVSIARALAVSPQILLMDEPLAALDNDRKQEILPYLETLHQSLDIPIIYISHSTDEVARLADYLVLLKAGKVQASGDIHQLLTRLDLPLAHQDGAETIIETTVAEHDEKYHLSYLDFSGGRFTVEKNNLPIGSKVRLRIAARDVSITLKAQSGTSILNIFPASIQNLMPEGKSQVIAQLQVGDTPLLARLTQKSADLLSLTVGKQVFVQLKSVAVLAG